MKTAIVTIDPEMAQKHLKSNHMKQRNLSPSLVTHYAQQMKAGQWLLNGEPIIFDNDGNLLDGQHRLHSIIKSGVSCEMLVVSGVDQDSFITINGGKSRSMANVMAISGITNYTAVSSCVHGAMNYRRALKTTKFIKNDKGESIKTEMGGSLSSYIRPSKTDVLNEYKKHSEEYQKACRIASKCKHLANMSAFSTIAALALIDGSKPEFVDGFFDSLSKGLFDNENAPEYRLRTRLEQNRAARHKMTNNHLVLLIAKAWNYYATERECKILRINSEAAFPIE